MPKRIALMAVDSDYPNLALMKVATHHRRQGNTVEWYNPFDRYDTLYMSKIFGFTPDWPYHINNADEVVRGGTGYDLTATLPEEMEHITPDYSIYPKIDKRTAYGFLTRGCPNKCKWCVVPMKEGGIRPYQTIQEIAVDGRDHIILMDNNVLASDFGLSQIEEIIRLGLHVDFNQALDARLVTSDIARLLARVKWIKRIRFGCDTPAQIGECERAMDLIDKSGYKGEYFFYCILLDDFNESFRRVNHWRERGGRYIPHCQPYRDIDNPHQQIPQWQRDMARWVNRKELFRTCDFADFEDSNARNTGKNFNENKIEMRTRLLKLLRKQSTREWILRQSSEYRIIVVDNYNGYKHRRAYIVQRRERRIFLPERWENVEYFKRNRSAVYFYYVLLRIRRSR